MQHSTDSCCEHITGGVNIHLYGCVSLLTSDHAVCLCLCLDVWYHIRVLAKKQIMSQTSVNSMLCFIKHTAGSLSTKVPRVDMCRSIVSLSKLTNQMWQNHPLIQRNKATERAVGWRLEASRGFPTWEMGWKSPTSQKFAHPPRGKINPSSRQPPQNFYAPSNG